MGIIIDGLRLQPADANLLIGNSPTLAELKLAINLHEIRIMNHLKAATARFRPAVSTPAPTRNQSGPSRESPRPAGGRPTSQDEMRCLNCRKRGHRAADCPYPERPNNACFRCWNTGHAYKDCKSPTAFIHTYRPPLLPFMKTMPRC